jgi:hypothetical protein
MQINSIAYHNPGTVPCKIVYTVPSDQSAVKLAAVSQSVSQPKKDSLPAISHNKPLLQQNEFTLIL